MAVDPEQFCFYPFTQLLLQPTGVISPCCWNQDVVLGTVPQEKLSDIWNGQKIRELRREFLDGKPMMCRTQMRHVGCHRWSRRHDSPKIEQLTEQVSGWPRRLDVRLNGKCNLQCVMCEVWKQPNGLYDQSDFWTLGPEKIFPYLKEIDVLGGEPFVQADTFRLIDEVVAVNKDCQWAFVTNASYKFGPAIRRRLDQINIRWLQVSLDSVNPETYSKVRVGGDLEKTLAALNDYLNYAKERKDQGRAFKVTLSMCVQRLNWQEVGDFLAFAQYMNLHPELQFAYIPEAMSLLTLPEGERARVLQYFSEIAAMFGSNVVAPVLLPMKDSLSRLSLRETGVQI